jgi:hypothetical protein
MSADFETQPAWERRREVGFFKSILLTIRGVMFRPSETFSRFRWDGGYWNPILLCLLGCGISGITVLAYQAIPIIDGNLTAVLATLAGQLLGLFIGMGATVGSQFLFSGAVLGALYALRNGSFPYQGIFRVVTYTSVLIDLLNAILGLAICAVLPKPLWDPAQSVVLIILMIWQGYCIVVGVSKITSAMLWNPVTAVFFSMLLAYGAVEISSFNNPIGRKIWGAAYYALTGNHFQP